MAEATKEDPGPPQPPHLHPGSNQSPFHLFPREGRKVVNPQIPSKVVGRGCVVDTVLLDPRLLPPCRIFLSNTIPGLQSWDSLPLAPISHTWLLLWHLRVKEKRDSGGLHLETRGRLGKRFAPVDVCSEHTTWSRPRSALK